MVTALADALRAATVRLSGRSTSDDDQRRSDDGGDRDCAGDGKRERADDRADGEPSDTDRGRVHAAREDGVVVFVVGMRINAFRKLHRWLPIFLAGPRVVDDLRTSDDAGFLGSWTFVSPPRTVGFVQYWDSFDALEAYARDGDGEHVDAWQEYAGRAGDGAVGIWHETYRADDYETIYNHVPPRGLGAAAGSELVPATGDLDDAAGRLGAVGADDTGAGRPDH